MTRISIILAALILLPVAAAAQVAPIRPPGMTGAAPAQPSSRGITVSGTASTRVPATSAHIVLQLSSANRTMILDKDKVQPIVDALIKAGADPASVHLPLNFSAPGYSSNASISADFRRPSATMLQNGIVTVGSAIASMKDVVLNGGMVFLNVEHCADALESARHGAVAQARAKAESIARDLNVHVGGAINIFSMEQNTPDGSCSSQYYVNGFDNGPQSPQSPQDYVTVPVSSTIQITYAIK